MQKHITTITKGAQRAFIYSFEDGGKTCFVAARTTARVCIRNSAIYLRHTTQAGAENYAKLMLMHNSRTLYALSKGHTA